MGPQRSLCVLEDCNGSKLTLIGPYPSLWILMDPDGSYRSFAYLWALIGSYRSLCVSIDFNGSL